MIQWSSGWLRPSLKPLVDDRIVRILLLQLEARLLVAERHRDRLQIAPVVGLLARVRVLRQVVQGVFLALRPEAFAADVRAHAGEHLHAPVADEINAAMMSTKIATTRFTLTGIGRLSSRRRKASPIDVVDTDASQPISRAPMVPRPIVSICARRMPSAMSLSLSLPECRPNQGIEGSHDHDAASGPTVGERHLSLQPTPYRSPGAVPLWTAVWPLGGGERLNRTSPPDPAASTARSPCAPSWRTLG